MQSTDWRNFQREIGLIVDLTNTDIHYQREEVRAAGGCDYVKLSCIGHDLAPSSGQTDEFIRVVTRFIERGTGQLVGVHCTHGFNRTGYMICSFLVEVAKMDVESAFTTFKAARRPGIYKANYIERLCSVYGAESLPVPARPGWARD